MKQEYTAQELTIYIGEDDQWHGKPLYSEIVNRLQKANIAGITVFKGVEGYGAHHRIHTSKIEVLFQSMPLTLRSIDRPERIARALDALDDLLTEALVTVVDVHAIRYNKDTPA